MQVEVRPIRRVWCVLTLAVVVLCASSPRPAIAQPARTSFGVLLGGTSSRVTDLNTTSTDPASAPLAIANRYGYRGGLFINRTLINRFSLQAEAYYIQKGTLLNAQPKDRGSLNLSLDYLELPLLLRADLAPHSTWRPFVTAGPTMALRTRCRGAVRIDVYTIPVTCRELNDDPAKDLFVSSDIGMSGGAGIEHVVLGHSVLLQLRYGRGLTTIVNNPSQGISPKNSTFSLITGIGFHR